MEDDWNAMFSIGLTRPESWAVTGSSIPCCYNCLKSFLTAVQQAARLTVYSILPIKDLPRILSTAMCGFIQACGPYLNGKAFTSTVEYNAECFFATSERLMSVSFRSR